MTDRSTKENGTLYVVPTPIGNLDDLTIRALNTLKEVDVIAAEDTRNTQKLLNHFNITTRIISYHEHSDKKRTDYLIEQLSEGKSIALVSDAGMPGISDPGEVLIKEAIAANYHVVVLPGANAALTALVGSGLNTDQFYFYGFLPRKNKEKKAAIELLKKQPSTIILYESPYRVKETLMLLHKELGDRNVALARELTKRFEEYIRGTLSEALDWMETGVIKGEFCIVIEGGQPDTSEEDEWWKVLSVKEHVETYMNRDDVSSKVAIKQVAKDRNVAKREIYQHYHID
ncbi:16S rRNA (cytidine1402-2'-O)-methyltransferase [Pelagirhabdus alkalitolerans]|uniref:Ribosomal RNA small subunit methyltransferase I n=1 Tax=Pelagirhabdus alkalitolerans TaxID=1612202 RepID=A0A1G6MKG3_9BACI|nr:16S rRNA (cytidine(1402)-2'-O)-methyltransferase [Pelagirhabdus alkalitolerans]SDC56023.1 16S rRNA (cytidine1402-2'-O)-methyltransferase [Pelagirhabdus alkalitolerans]